MTPAPAVGQPWYHLLPGSQPAVLVVPGSMIFEVGDDTFAALDRGDPDALGELRSCIKPARTDSGEPPPVTALSLNVAQACNMSCAYCYADEGRFGGAARLMNKDVAFRGIDTLITNAAGRAVTVGFIGGEPFLNRALLHDCVDYARTAAARAGIAVRFSVTTNATLLRDDDIRLLRDNRFAVTVSIDGGPPHNGHRRLHGSRESAVAVASGIAPLLAKPGAARVAARTTVTRDDLDVAERIAWLKELGFTEAGVAPVRTSPRPELILREDDWAVFLESMIAASQIELNRVSSGGQPFFSTFGWRYGRSTAARRGRCLADRRQITSRSTPKGSSTAATEPLMRRGSAWARSRTAWMRRRGVCSSTLAMSTRRSPARPAGRVTFAAEVATPR